MAEPTGADVHVAEATHVTSIVAARNLKPRDVVVRRMRERTVLTVVANVTDGSVGVTYTDAGCDTFAAGVTVMRRRPKRPT